MAEELDTNQTKEPSHWGFIIGGLIIALAFILICIYLWMRSLATEPIAPPPTPQRPTAAENNEPESTTAEAQTNTLEVVSTSDELSAIEADLEATILPEIDADLNAIEAELIE